jgi:hypothetical protein
MDKYSIEKQCPECGTGTMKFNKSVKKIRDCKIVWRDSWACDNCENYEWQEKTEFVMDLEREETPDITAAIGKLKQESSEMLAAIKEIVSEFKSKNQLITTP